MDFVTIGVCIAALSILIQGWGEQKMDKFDLLITGICILTIAAGAIFGTWALLTVMSLQACLTITNTLNSQRKGKFENDQKRF